MIESIMFFGGGFLVAGLLALILISFVHNRAVRLTLRRLENAIPLSLAEIQADKDKLRAEFAMTTRRLEMTVEQLKAKATNQLGEIARKAEAIAKLRALLAEKTAITDELNIKVKSLSAKSQESEQGYAEQFAAAETTAQALAARETELAKGALDINELRLTNESQNVEIALLKTQIEHFKSTIEELQQDAEDAAQRLFDERVAASTVAKALEEQREAEKTWRAEHAENNLLRERIADIAAQVAQMSMNETSPPIAATLKDATNIRPASVNRDEGAGSNLADRIRKLQSAASRVSTAS